MSYKNIKTTYLRYSKTLQKLLTKEEFLTLLRNDDLLKEAYLIQLDIIYFLEQKLLDVELIEKTIADHPDHSDLLLEPSDLVYFTKLKEEYTTKIQSVSEHNFQNPDLKKLGDVQDLINYFTFFLKNKYNKKVEDFLKPKPVATQAPAANNQPQPQSQFTQPPSNNQPVNPTVNNSAYSRPVMPSMPANFPGNFAEMFAESNFLQMAEKKLQEEIVQGRYYLFSTKPKMVITIKKTLSFLITLLVIFIIGTFAVASFISEFVSATAITIQTNLNNNIVTNSAFNIITTIVFIIFYSYIAFNFAKNHTNENLKYDFDKKKVAFALFFTVALLIQRITVLIQLYSPALGRISSIGADAFIEEVRVAVANRNNFSGGYTGRDIDLFLTLSGFEITVMVFSLITIVVMIIGWAAAPKIDLPRRDLKIKQLVEEFRQMFSDPSRSKVF